MAKQAEVRGGKPGTTTVVEAAVTRRVLAKEAVEQLFAADDEELAADLAELSGAAAQAVDEVDDEIEGEEEEEGEEGEEEEEVKEKRPKAAHNYVGWCPAKGFFLTSVGKRGTYLQRGLEVGGYPELAAKAARMVAEAHELRAAIAAFPTNWHPPAAPRTSGRRRSRTDVGAAVRLRKDVQKQYAGLYEPAILAAPCKVIARNGRWRRLQLADGREIGPIICSRIVTPRTEAATAAPAAGPESRV